MAFSIVMPESMKNLEQKWIPEVHHQSPSSAYLVVGTQCDLRDDEKIKQKLQKRRQRPVTIEEGQKLAKRVNADCYVECSALTRQGLKDVFDEALIAVLDPKVKRKSERKKLRCVLL
jgi:cell division control protein 42